MHWKLKVPLVPEPKPLNLYIRFAGAFTNFLMSPFISMTQQRERKQRKPFRNKSERELIDTKVGTDF